MRNRAEMAIGTHALPGRQKEAADTFADALNEPDPGPAGGQANDDDEAAA